MNRSLEFELGNWAPLPPGAPPSGSPTSCTRGNLPPPSHWPALDRIRRSYGSRPPPALSLSIRTSPLGYRPLPCPSHAPCFFREGHVALLATISIGRPIAIPTYQVSLPPFSSRSSLPSDHPATMTRPLPPPSHTFGWLTRRICGLIRQYPLPNGTPSSSHVISSPAGIVQSRGPCWPRFFLPANYDVDILGAFAPFSLLVSPSFPRRRSSLSFLHVISHTILIYQVSLPPFSSRPPFPSTIPRW